MNTKELKSIIRLAIKKGYTVELRKNNHYKFTAPTGKFFFTSATPSDHRAIANIVSDMKRAEKDES
jgi:hypothetical protein